MSETERPIQSGRVMFVSSIARYGGGERWMCDASSGLQARGHAVLLVSRPGSELARKAAALAIPDASVEMRADLDPAAISQLVGLVRRFEPDVVCVNLDRTIRLCGAALKLSRNPARLIPRRGSEFPLKNKMHYRFVYTKLVDRVIANSRATKQTMIAPVSWFSPDKAVVIYNGINIDEYDALDHDRDKIRAALRTELKFPADAAIVVLVGELNARKGQQFIIEAATQIIQKAPHTRFVFVGEGDGRARIESDIEASGLAAHFRLTGFRDDIARILTASDVLVLPSSVEGFGYVLVEAMAARLPVVASNASSIPEIVSDDETGFLHVVGDSDAIADRLIRLLTDQTLASTLGQNGYERARQCFSIDRMLDDLESLFFG